MLEEFVVAARHSSEVVFVSVCAVFPELPFVKSWSGPYMRAALIGTTDSKHGRPMCSIWAAMAPSRPSTSHTGLRRLRICAARRRLSSRQAALPHGHPIHARTGSLRALDLPVQARSRPSTSRAACATRASAERVSDSTAGSRRGFARAAAVVSPITSVPIATSALQTPLALHRARHCWVTTFPWLVTGECHF